jgi:hypothetical protein
MWLLFVGAGVLVIVLERLLLFETLPPAAAAAFPTNPIGERLQKPCGTFTRFARHDMARHNVARHNVVPAPILHALHARPARASRTVCGA